MDYIFFIFLGLAVVVLTIFYLRSKKRHSAACNVVFAKYTFNKLQPEQQNNIHDKAVEMVLASNTRLEGFANEVERFGWYALAMNALGINSMVPDNPCWGKVKNPYAAILPGDSMIYNITGALQSQYEIEIKVSADRGYDDHKKASGK